MADNKEVILQIKVDDKEAINNIIAFQDALAGLKKEQKELQDQMKKGEGTEEMKQRLVEIGTETKLLNDAIRSNKKELELNAKAYAANEKSLAQYRSEIANLKQKYNELSESERNGAKGQKMIENLQSLTTAAKSAEIQMQGVPKGISNIAATMGQVTPVAGKAVSALGKVGTAMKALLANPLAIVISAIVLAVTKLIDAFKKNDKAMTELQSAFAAFKPILDLINKGFQALVGVITNVISGISSFVQKITSFIPGLREYAEAEEDIVRSTDALEDAEREYSTNHSNREKEISELRSKAVESEKYTVKERRKFLEDALKLEKEDVEEKKAIAKEKYRIAEREALLEIGLTEMTAEAWEKLSDEQKNHLTSLKNAVTDVETESNNATRRMTSQLNSFDKEQSKLAEERKKKEKEALQQLEDMYIEAIKDMEQKEIAQLKVANQRKIDALKDRLKTETNLTAATRQAINNQIILLEADLQVKLGNINKKYAEQRQKQLLSLQQQYFQEVLKAASGEQAIQYQQIISNMVYDAQIQALKERKEFINETLDEMTDEAAKAAGLEMQYIDAMVEALGKSKSLAQKKILLEGENAIDAIKKSNAELEAMIADNKMVGLYYDNEVEKSKIFEEQSQRRLKAAQDEYNRLQGLSKEDQKILYGDAEHYQQALLTAQNQVVLAENAVTEASRKTTMAIANQKNTTIETFKTIADGVNGILDSFQSIFETLAESDEKYKAYSTALAMMNILVSTAVSIANAIQGATAAGAATGAAAPFTTPAFIIEMVGIVTSAIASATATLKKAQQSAPSTPKFATGGLVGNQTTTRTDDSVNAKLSVGEYVIQSKAVKALGVPLLDALNGGKGDKTYRFATGGYVPSLSSIQTADQQMNYEMMKDMFMEVVKEINPVVSVKEINSAQNMVKIKETVAGY